MMTKYHGSQTEKNLLVAFAGESMARNRYEFFAKVARKEGYQQIAALFEESALHERSHAKRFFKLLPEKEVRVEIGFVAGMTSTLENLEAAARGERHEHTMLYPSFARVAREEGFEAAAKAFETVAQVEAVHERRFSKLARRLREGTLFTREAPTLWFCRKCGHVHEGKEAPDICPACLHPKGYFEEYANNW